MTSRLTFDSASDLAQALLRAGTAHGEYEERLGQGRDEDWPSWYARYIERDRPDDPARSSAEHLTFASASDLGQALLRAEGAHGAHQERTGGADPDWPSWYATYFEHEQARERETA
jgi:hypothetical protein